MVFVVLFVLALLIALVFGFGDRQPIRVQTFSWEGKQISVQDKSFSLSFSEAINPQFVVDNLSIDPPLKGTLSWVGKKFFYTLSELPIYGQDYQLKLTQAPGEATMDKGAKPTHSSSALIEPFVSRFQSRDRAFAYIGTEGEEHGRLILFNLTKQQKSILTPADITVLNFEAYPGGDRLLFSAIPRAALNTELKEQQLYTVTTGLNYEHQPEPPTTGKIDLVLDAKDYINGHFQLAGNGQRIVIQRTSRENERDRSLWVIEGKQVARPLGIPADEFLLSPNGEAIALSQQNKLSILPLAKNGGVIQAKEEFSRLLAFSPDNTEQIVLQEADGIRSIHVLTPDGGDRVLLRTLTPIIDCRFEPRYKETLYCLKIDQKETNGELIEEPFLSALDLKTGDETPLLALPNYRDVRLSVAADGVALLFDQVVTADPQPDSNLFTQTGLAVEGARLWLLTLPELEVETKMEPIPPESLMPGFRPQWIP